MSWHCSDVCFKPLMLCIALCLALRIHLLLSSRRFAVPTTSTAALRATAATCRPKRARRRARAPPPPSLWAESWFSPSPETYHVTRQGSSTVQSGTRAVESQPRSGPAALPPRYRHNKAQPRCPSSGCTRLDGSQQRGGAPSPLPPLNCCRQAVCIILSEQLKLHIVTLTHLECLILHSSFEFTWQTREFFSLHSLRVRCLHHNYTKLSLMESWYDKSPWQL